MVAQARGAAGAVGGGARGWCVLVCIGLLGGCGTRRLEPTTAPPPLVEPRPGPTVPAGAQAYAIDPGRSVVTLRVYRAGPLARLGHNHVITSTDEAGYAWTSGELTGSGFEVRVPVAGLVVDDPAARAAAGPDFPGEVPAEAREGTRRNLLRPEVLDGERHPEIIVQAETLGGTWEAPVVLARVIIRGQARVIEVPLAIVRESGALAAQGTFRLLQSEFGITPFSVAGGAIQVADAVDVYFEVGAVRR